MTFEFKDLPYATNALEPYIDQKTMEIHHGKHHKAYYDNFLKALEGTEQAKQTLEQIFANIAKSAPALRNNGGGYFNHNFFWKCMHPKGMREPEGKLGEEVKKVFGGYAQLVEQLKAAGMARFGSGFAWLIVGSQGKLEVISTPNQNNPLMGDEPKVGKPLMAIDVWEHAYYLHYQNRRADYLSAFFNVICWQHASELFSKI